MSTAVHLSLYSGRELLGRLVQCRGGWKAIDRRGRLLGKFKSKKAALEKIDPVLELERREPEHIT